MSRSNPQVNAPNPSARWFEWNGETGLVRYYDKEEKKNVDMPLPFTFLLLDELATVRGWHKPSASGLYANEVRDTRTEPFVVKAFKGGTLVEGLYKAIKDRIATLGGQYVANCYIAFKHERGLAIGSLRFKGSSLGSWMEFRQAHRSMLFSKAIDITGSTEGKTGRIVFRMPMFKLRDTTEDTNVIAADLDRELQTWLTGYFNRRTTDQAVPTVPADDDTGDTYPDATQGELPPAPYEDDDIPFAWLVPLVAPLLAGALYFC